VVGSNAPARAGTIREWCRREVGPDAYNACAGSERECGGPPSPVHDLPSTTESGSPRSLNRQCRRNVLVVSVNPPIKSLAELIALGPLFYRLHHNSRRRRASSRISPPNCSRIPPASKATHVAYRVVAAPALADCCSRGHHDGRAASTREGRIDYGELRLAPGLVSSAHSAARCRTFPTIAEPATCRLHRHLLVRLRPPAGTPDRSVANRADASSRGRCHPKQCRSRWRSAQRSGNTPAELLSAVIAPTTAPGKVSPATPELQADWV